MRVLVAYATKHGATTGIAERIGDVLREAGQKVDVLPVDDIRAIDQYDAFVVGSAVYLGSWRKEAVALLRHHADVLATRPVWLFSSGPVATEEVGTREDQLNNAVSAKQLAELTELVQPRDHHVFFGAVDRSTFGLGERLLGALPAGRKLLPEGDFREWGDIEGWSAAIAAELAGVPA